MRRLTILILLAAASPAPVAAAPPFDPAEALPGGAATAAVDDASAAFARPVGNLPEAERARFLLGARYFYTRWVAGPAPAPALTGVGPLYNALSCEQCHRNDGRGRPPALGVDETEVTGAIARFAALSAPYGAQLQDFAIGGQAAEGRLIRSPAPVSGGSGGGFGAVNAPVWRIGAPGYGPVPAAISAVIAPQVNGVGLIDAIPAAAIRAAADPDDRDGDGISGVAVAGGAGRFGWRAAQASVEGQAARALALDMGLSTARYPNHWGDCAEAQQACRMRARAGAAAAVEIDGTILDAIVQYTANLGPPARPDAARPDVLAGRAAFHGAGCAQCHTPSHVTGPNAYPWLSGQTIWPYSDFLLHDMGEGLGDAGGQEWRTPALWGLGRHGAVNGHAQYLHDGRAETLSEAVLWHGGEAARARDAFRALSPVDRDALLAFLSSL